MSRLNLCFLPRFISVFLLLAGLSGASMAQVAPTPPIAPVGPSSPPEPQPEVMALLDKGTKALSAADTLRWFNEALDKARVLKDKVGEVTTLRITAVVYDSLSQPQKALEFYQQALPLYRGLGNKRGEANTLDGIANAYLNIGQPQKALEFLQQALPLNRGLGNKRGEATTLNNIGAAYDNLGQPQKALEFYQQALPLNRGLGNKRGEATTLYEIGVVYDSLSQPQKALEFYQQALPLHRQIGNKAGEADTLDGIGGVYDALSQPQKALELYQQALPLHRQSGNKRGEANTLSGIGSIYDTLGQPQKALEFYQQALLLQRKITDKLSESKTLHDIGSIYGALGQPQKALDLYQQALLLYRQVGDKGSEAIALYDIGVVYGALGQPQKALDLYQQALLLYRQVGSKGREATTLNNMAVVQEKGGHLREAERYLKDALVLVESVREDLGGLSEAKVSFLTSKLHTYYRYVHLLLKMDKPADAFAIVQKTKARALLDLMASSRVDIRQQMTAAEKHEEQELRGWADQLNAQMVKEGVQNEIGAKKRFAALKAQLAQAESALQKFTDSLYARHPELARKRAAKTATLADMARLLPTDTALLEYIVLKTGVGKEAIDQTVLFVVTTNAGKALVRTYSLSASGDTLAKKSVALRLACADPRKPYKVQAQEMYRLLLPPAAVRHLSGKKRLILCPDGPLWDVPFAALRDKQGRFLLERHELAFAYSATGTQATVVSGAEKKKLRAASATKTLLVLANPDFGGEKRFGDNPLIAGQRPIEAPSRPIEAPSRPIEAPSRPIEAPSRPIAAPSREMIVPRGGSIVALPGTQREAAILRNLFPHASIYTGNAAQEGRVKQDAKGFRFLHLASHAFFNDAAPLLSSVVLARPPGGSSEDGFLTAREIFDMKLSGTDMVVFSACNTARGEKQSGEGIVGLTWALFVAGVPTQVLSQWAVDDASTAVLMGRFYSDMTKGGQAKGEALRDAALSLRKEPRYSHPYYWAPFVLMGDWRK